MEPKRRYTQVVKRPFHISMAALDIFSADEEPTQVMLFFEGRNYLLCTLQKGQMVQCALDLNFEIGDEVVFATNGNSNIHLSGYIQEQFDELLDEEEEDEEEVEQDEPLKEGKSKKKKPGDKLTAKQPPTKKSKLADLLQEDYSSNDEDESYVVSEPADDEGEEEEEDDDDDDLDEEDEELEEDKSDVSSLSDEEIRKPTKQMNEETPKNEKKTKTKTEKTPLKTTKTDGQQKNTKNSGFTESPSQQNKKTLEGGVIIQDLKVGDGNIAKSGRMVQVYYEGRLKQNNKLFDQTNKGAGFKFRLGKQEVIKGWDIGVVGMKIGGRRRIICPPAMAYGQKGSPPAIPPNSTLVFEVELKNIV
ncbi:hypothetical protein FQR65_LT08908 [Abscondita terminalis]|nr:hypothetical protein FQR65_LT08908 [Abscondita terminalis]